MRIRTAFLLAGLSASGFTLHPAETATSVDSELAQAAENGDLQKVEALIKAKANVNARIPAGATCLMLAAKHPAVIKVLIEAGADVNALNFKSGTALMYAVEQGVVESVKQLIAAGAKIDHVSEEGVTALLVAANAGNLSMTEVLLDAGAGIDLAGPNGVTALSYAAGNGFQNPETAANNLKVIHLLVKRGAKINTVSSDGETPLISAAKICSEPNLAALLEYDVTVELKSAAGKTALDLACTLPDNNYWDKETRQRVRKKLLTKAARQSKGGVVPGILIGKVFSVTGQKIEITGPGIVNLTNGNKIIIKNSAGSVTATVTEILHTKAKARISGNSPVAAGDPVHLVK